MSKELAKREGGKLSVATSQRMAEIQRQTELVTELHRTLMLPGVHYGKIPGCDKPSLFKAGAERLAVSLQLNVKPVRTEVQEHDKEHKTFTVYTTVYDRAGNELGHGIGICSTLEVKYRYRNDVALSDKPVPKEYWTTKDASLLGGKGNVPKKNDKGQWVIAKVAGKVENENPADLYNTCCKMAEKRSKTDAVLSATAASDVYTQDAEDIADVFGGYQNVIDADYTTEREPLAPPKEKPAAPAAEPKTEAAKPAPAAPTNDEPPTDGFAPEDGDGQEDVPNLAPVLALVDDNSAPVDVLAICTAAVAGKSTTGKDRTAFELADSRNTATITVTGLFPSVASGVALQFRAAKMFKGKYYAKSVEVVG